MRFSVVIPTYNREKHIGDTIKTVLGQSFTDFEVIIVDDGSTDDTKSVVDKFEDKRITYYKTDNRERGAARNYGVSVSKGNYITFLDSDDKLYPDHLMIANVSISKFEQPEIFHINFEIRDQNNNVIKRNKLAEPINDSLIKGNHIGCMGIFLRKDIMKVNLFNEDRQMAGLEDWELWLRIATKYKIHYEPTITSCVIQHDERSVISDPLERLIGKTNTFLKAVSDNKDINKTYSSEMNYFYSSAYSYLSLHIALTKRNRLIAIKYLIRSITYSPVSIFSRRFLAIIKHLVF